VLGYTFRSRDLLRQALTHDSVAAEAGERGRSNERLEFLGDAVLDLLVSELLMRADPDADEGRLTKARAAAVNTRALSERAAELGLGQAMYLGRGEERQGGRGKPSILANVFEAVFAALYLDGGLEVTREVVGRVFGDLATGGLEPVRDPKTRLQEHLQARGEDLPRYETVREGGPDHAREFEVEVVVGGRGVGRGVGRSRQAAEQEAAARALEALGA
jgi:ribonuclease-3